MKNNIQNIPTLLRYIIVASGFLYSCGNNAPVNSQPTGFPQSSRNDTAAKSLNGSIVNFVSAAKAVTPGVVHIKTIYEGSSGTASLSERYGRGDAPAMASGSGVVLSADGYIATNNHVVENASQVEVIFPDRRQFPAKVIGRDPNTDLALLKVDAKDLSIVELGNSDDVEVGEWVLAVGYPYSLNTTVTAGIISAKGRSIGIINRSGPAAFSQGTQQANTAIESFIQTDAAINPGNSGGALVDMNGKLIGINTAIASLTGSYAGYAFAIPVNLAKKILDDLKQFGVVKRGMLGVSFPAPAAEDQYLQQQGIKPGSVKGVFIIDIQKGSAADAAGLQEGDIIQSIDGIEIFSSAEFSEKIARHRPGDKIKFDYLRNGKSQSTSATLKGEEQQKSVASDSQSLQELHNRLGAIFSPLTPALKERYNLSGGVVVTQVSIGGFFYQLGIPPGTIIAYINGKIVNSREDINEALIDAQNKRVQVLGIAPDGSRIAFDFSLGT